MSYLLGIFDPSLWLTPIPLAIVWIIAKDRGWRKGWREAHARNTH